MIIRELSPNKISIFRRCPKQFHFEYLDLEMAKIKKLIKKKRPESETGTFVHDALTLFFKEPLGKRTPSLIKDILKKLWNGPRGREFGFQSLEDERRYYQEALSMLKWFVESEDINPHIFALPLSPPGRSFDDYVKVQFEGDLLLGGKVDRIDIEEDGTLKIIDYKTGKPEDNFLQLLTYVFLAEGIYGKEVSRAENLYLKHRTRKVIIPETSIREKAKSEILEASQKINAEENWDPQISRLCAYCDYVHYCPQKEKIRELLGSKFPEEGSDLPTLDL